MNEMARARENRLKKELGPDFVWVRFFRFWFFVKMKHVTRGDIEGLKQAALEIALAIESRGGMVIDE